MARMVKKAGSSADTYKRTVTWDPVSRRNYLLRMWLTLGGAGLILLGAALEQSAPAVGSGSLAVGLVVTLLVRFTKRWLPPYRQPTITHEGDYRSWARPGLLIGIGLVLLFSIILFAVSAAHYH